MTNNFKGHEYLKEVLTEMCNRVGVDIEDIDFREQAWYERYVWTEEEQEDFRLWLNQYLYEIDEARAEITPLIPEKNIELIDKATKEFILKLGWVTIVR